MNKNNFYSDKLVKKPWGEEYIIYKDNNKLAVTLVKINYNHKTSLHCHPKKKTGFIILDGIAAVQIGIYKKNVKKYKSLSRLVLRPGLFHSLKAVSKSGVTALEFETPYKKRDLIRFKDNYGRENKKYEGKKFTNQLNSSYIKFNKPKLGQTFRYKFKKVEVIIEKKKKLNNYFIKDNKSSVAILDGNIVNKNSQNVISFGEIVKTSTLKIFSERFNIKKPLTLLRVKKV